MPRLADRACTVLALTLFAACSAQQERPLVGVSPLVTVVAPPAAPGDAQEALTDERVLSRGGWYCTEHRPPLAFEWMFADSDTRSIGAVAIVPGNLGPQGLGTVTFRVQRGHGARARATAFEAAIPHVADGATVVIVFPHAVTGDHLVLEIPTRSAHVAAVCLAEIAVWSDGVAAVRAVHPDAQIDAHEPSTPSESPPPTLVDAGTNAHDP